MKKLLKSRLFWRNLVLMVVASFLIVLLILVSLQWFTRHGKTFKVPDLTGLTIDQLQSLHREYGFEFTIIDSVFDENSLPGTVVRHDPAPESTVKRGRKFYITTAATLPDMVLMPNLKDLSFRQATARLEAIGLAVGNITYKPDFSNNAVLQQHYQGQPIIPGERVRRGEKIDLTVSKNNE